MRIELRRRFGYRVNRHKDGTARFSNPSRNGHRQIQHCRTQAAPLIPLIDGQTADQYDRNGIGFVSPGSGAHQIVFEHIGADREESRQIARVGEDQIVREAFFSSLEKEVLLKVR